MDSCKTIQETLNNDPSLKLSDSAYVMIRIYQLAEANHQFVQDITYATNSQNPVDLRDLRSNDQIQMQLEMGIKEMGYIYKRQREVGSKKRVITSSIATESVLAIWRERPHQAKFRIKEHFGKLYENIFNGLNASQLLIAVLIFGFIENERKRSATAKSPDFLPYASHYIAMLMGRELLNSQNIELEKVSLRNVKTFLKTLEENRSDYYRNAVDSLRKALKECYGDRVISLQQLSATFRRGDLLEMLGVQGLGSMIQIKESPLKSDCKQL